MTNATPTTMSITECTKTIRTLSNGTLTTDLHKITMSNREIQARLELRFVRKGDNKSYVTIQSNGALCALPILAGNPMIVAKWLSKVEYVIPLDRECVVFFSHEERFTHERPIVFILLEEVDSHVSAFLEEKKTIYELEKRLMALGSSRDKDVANAIAEQQKRYIAIITSREKEIAELKQEQEILKQQLLAQEAVIANQSQLKQKADDASSARCDEFSQNILELQAALGTANYDNKKLLSALKATESHKNKRAKKLVSTEKNPSAEY